MTYIFDGKNFAQEKEVILTEKVAELNKKGIYPKLVSIIIGDDPASQLYVNLKKKAGERVGINVEVRSWESEVGIDQVIEATEKMGEDKTIHGVMVQLPLPANFSIKDRERIVNSIDLAKDVDGLRENSGYIHPTSKAVLEILGFALDIVPTLKVRPCKVMVVGSTGMVGRPLVRKLRSMNFELIEADSETLNLYGLAENADVIISATGVPGIIKANMVKNGAILIDVGAPKGDIEKAAYEKASFVSPVPGGVGPVTISCLMENIIESAQI